MTCPTCGNPRPEERRYIRKGEIIDEPEYHPRTKYCAKDCQECADSYHNQISDSEARERVLPSLY